MTRKEEERINSNSFHANRISFRSTNSRSLYREKKRTLNLRIRYNARFRSDLVIIETCSTNAHWISDLHEIPYRFPLFYRLWIYGPLPFILPFSLLSLAYRARWSRNNWLVISLQVTSSAGECTRIFSTFLGLLGGILIMIVIIEID